MFISGNVGIFAIIVTENHKNLLYLEYGMCSTYLTTNEKPDIKY